MRKIALGRLRIPAREYGRWTLAELYDAISGHEEEENNRRQWYLWGVRRHIFCYLKSKGAKNLEEEDIIPLDMDEEIRKDRLKNMPRVTVTIDGKPE